MPGESGKPMPGESGPVYQLPSLAVSAPENKREHLSGSSQLEAHSRRHSLLPSSLGKRWIPVLNSQNAEMARATVAKWKRVTHFDQYQDTLRAQSWRLLFVIALSSHDCFAFSWLLSILSALSSFGERHLYALSKVTSIYYSVPMFFS